jgi:glycosyltransferase involved in cell wall biosynthesis
MRSTVTLGIPLYRKMEYLPTVLASVDAQDYGNLDVLVSDNGCNGPELEELVSRHLRRPHRYRSNTATVDISAHFNQLVDEAQGDYFVLLSDDDQLSPNYVSELAAVLDQDSDVGVALARAERMDEAGNHVAPTRELPDPPPRMDGLEFIRRWCRTEADFVCFVTNMARTAEIRACGGYPDLAHGTSTDNALVIKLSLGRKVAWVGDAVFRYRVFENSYGLALSPARLAGDIREFMRILDEDPEFQKLAREHPEDWEAARALLVRMSWGTYRHRWKNMYADRLSLPKWILAAFEMPWIPEYYLSVWKTILRRGRSAVGRRVRLSGPRHRRS